MDLERKAGARESGSIQVGPVLILVVVANTTVRRLIEEII